MEFLKSERLRISVKDSDPVTVAPLITWFMCRFHFTHLTSFETAMMSSRSQTDTPSFLREIEMS